MDWRNSRVFCRFQGYGLDAALPIALLLIIVALVVLILLRLALLPENK
jgi:ABC-type sulfate transport system permease component